jgi:hypothetical protein
LGWFVAHWPGVVMAAIKFKFKPGRESIWLKNLIFFAQKFSNIGS